VANSLLCLAKVLQFDNKDDQAPADRPRGGRVAGSKACRRIVYTKGPSYRLVLVGYGRSEQPIIGLAPTQWESNQCKGKQPMRTRGMMFMCPTTARRHSKRYDLATGYGA
jgi:hypothetical protein